MKGTAKELVVASCDVLPPYLPGGPEEGHGDLIIVVMTEIKPGIPGICRRNPTACADTTRSRVSYVSVRSK